MPPRKSNVSTISNAVEETAAESTPVRTTKDKDGLSVDDLTLPKSMIGRLAKGVLPPSTQIHRDALLALHKSATVFVSYLAANSNDFAQGSGKKTISPQDVMSALKEAELDEFIPRLEAELKKYNDTQCDKRNTYRRKVKEEKAAAAAGNDDDDAASKVPKDGAVGETSGLPNGSHANGNATATPARPSKKLKRANGGSTGMEPATIAMAEDDEDGAGTEDDDRDAERNEDDGDDDDNGDDDEGEEGEASAEGEEDVEDEDGEEDDDEEEEGEEEQDGLDDEQAIQNQLRDEALDEPDSD